LASEAGKGSSCNLHGIEYDLPEAPSTDNSLVGLSAFASCAHRSRPHVCVLPQRAGSARVVLYLEHNDQSQWTVVTETSGPLKGKRVVRGREADCRTHYEAQASTD